MNEFNNRIDAQRNILRTVNKHSWSAEKLSGLSNKAIDRWILANQIDASSRLAELIRSAGRALYFLASKSQEQITDEYKYRSQDVASITDEIATELRNRH